MRYLIELPGDDGGASIRDFIAEWIETPGLRRIVEREGGEWPDGTLEERVESLHEFSERWDFRSGAERLEIDAVEEGLDSEQIAVAGNELGLTAAEAPSQAHYDHGLVLGGTALASIYRLRRLYELRDSGVEMDHIAALTALRAVNEAELKLVRERPEVADLAEGVKTEFDAMTAVTVAFSHESAAIEYTANKNPHLASARAWVGDALVLAAPSGDPSRRANTRDNYDVYFRQIKSGAPVLIITSSIYLPYQFFVWVQAPVGWTRRIEADGFPPEWVAGVLTGPMNILQEIRSALFGAMVTLGRLPKTKNP